MARRWSMVIVCSFFFAALALLIACVFVFKGYAERPILAKIPIEFVIEPGSSLREVSSALKHENIIDDPHYFILLTNMLGFSRSLRAGDYMIPPGITHNDLLSFFVRGRVRYYSVTIVEGMTFMQMLETLNSNKKLSDPILKNQISQVLKRLGLEGHPEGWFYPDTYFFETGDEVASILQRSYDRMKKVLQEEWNARPSQVPYQSSYEVLIMASIVEKETGAVFERPQIAGVMLRRLEKKMRLQSDPTVIYGLGNRIQNNLTRALLRTKTAYNTYMMKGLPPTPIALVGRDAIRASLNPAPGNSYYFVAKGDGTHYFSQTLAEHREAVKKYQLQRREDYRSTVQP